MRTFEIFVEPKSSRDVSPETHGARLSTAPVSGPRQRVQIAPSRRRKTKEVLDLFIQGANVTARVAERQASCVLRDLAFALAELRALPRGKRIVRFYEDAWELCVERLGAVATLSVYRGGKEPTVLVYDREVVWEEMCASVAEAIDIALARDEVPVDLAEAARALRADLAPVDLDESMPEPEPVSVDLVEDAPISFAADFTMRPHVESSSDLEGGVERADLHALLVRGWLRAEIRGVRVDLGQAYPFLFAERLLDLTARALDAWERGQAFFARLDAGGPMIGLRSIAEANPSAALTMSAGVDSATISTFPELSLFDVVEAALAFGRSLVRAFVRRDRTQSGNLRLGALRRELRNIGESLREVRRQDARINPAPESYRAFALARPKVADAPSLAQARLRYTQRWRALVPGIDLRATFLCGERIVIGAAHETYCLDRTTGELLWRKPTPRATSVVTPSGIARISADGAIALHDFASGEVTIRTWIAPRLSGPCSGAVVSTPGLPRLLIVTEGERHLAAIDLTSGEARWRYAWGRADGRRNDALPGNPGAVRLKRVGKLVYVACGDSALTALDVQNGSVVWRVRDRLRFRASPTFDHDALFAVAGGANSAASITSIDPWSGRVLWSSPARGARQCTVEGPVLANTVTACLAVRERNGLRLQGFDRETGAARFETEPVAPVGTSWLAVDDLIVGNTPMGELLAVDGASGQVRWKHTLGSGLESDVPRRLEPVLRSGALFVPHVDVEVFRPGDGTHLGKVGPCDAIPDFVRVDERCDVYVAEESGHMAAFGVGPRLSLVK